MGGYLFLPSFVDHVAVANPVAIGRSELAEDDSATLVANLQRQLVDSRRDIDVLQAKLTQSVAENGSIRMDLGSAGQELQGLREQRDQLSTAPDALMLKRRALEETSAQAAAAPAVAP